MSGNDPNFLKVMKNYIYYSTLLFVMKELIFLCILALIILVGCQTDGPSLIGYTGTLNYQEAGENICEAYFLSAYQKTYMVDASKIENIEQFVGKEVAIKGKVIDGPGLRKCLFEKTIIAENIEIYK